MDSKYIPFHEEQMDEMPLPDDISRIKSFYKSAQEQISSEMAQTKYRSRLEQDPKLKNFLRKLQKRGG